MYTLMAVYVHFYRFIELMINYHTHPFSIIGFKEVVVSLGALWSICHDPAVQLRFGRGISQNAECRTPNSLLHSRF